MDVFSEKGNGEEEEESISARVGGRVVDTVGGYVRRDVGDVVVAAAAAAAAAAAVDKDADGERRGSASSCALSATEVPVRDVKGKVRRNGEAASILSL
jgi:hypothetical protein